MECKDLKALLAGYLDQELTPEEQTRLGGHLSHCSECREELLHLKEVKGMVESMKEESFPDGFWDRYWLGIYNRLERGVAWVLVSAGAALLLAFGVFHFVQEVLLDPTVPWIARLGSGLLAAGLAVLLGSLIRERIHSWRRDPYKEVQR